MPESSKPTSIPIDDKTLGVRMPYSTLKYIQRKGRNQVPARTSATWERRHPCLHGTLPEKECAGEKK